MDAESSSGTVGGDDAAGRAAADGAADGPERPRPRRVVVVGMHRSGTSSVTRVMNLLGLPVCRPTDRLVGGHNRFGYWESASLSRFQDRLLHRFGSAWYAPALVDGWHRTATATELLDEARATFTRAHPTDDWVWKDPRTCLTLPFWHRALGDDLVHLLVLRHPAAVAASLRARHGVWPLRSCVALWEHHVRSALRHLAGRPVVTVHYEHLLAAPDREVAELRTAFEELGVDLAGSPLEAAGSIRPPGARPPTDVRLTASQRRLLAACEDLDRCAPRFRPPALGRPSRGLLLRFPHPDGRWSVRSRARRLRDWARLSTSAPLR